MITKEVRNVLSVLLGFFALLIASSTILTGFQVGAPADTATPTESAPISENEIKSLVAPIALYPDNLVALVLAASTFPDQVAIADYWLQQNKNLKGNARVQAVDKQFWNASVKGLTQFPTVLHNMATSLSWTSRLGDAYHNQKSEVMAAVQTLRAQAKAAGNLKSTPQMTVEQQSPQTIVIQPANQQVVYVQQYNPAVIYGYPYVTPGYSAADVAAASAISFGTGVALGSWASSGWGWHTWGTDWAGGAVVYNHNTFIGNTAWHGGYAGAYHPYRYDGGYHPYGDEAFNRNEFNRDSFQNFQSNHFSDANSWAHHDNWSGRSTAFSGLGGHTGGFGGGFGGWSSRADSSRGWGSLRASGFGGFHGFGGGGFHGRR